MIAQAMSALNRAVGALFALAFGLLGGCGGSGGDLPAGDGGSGSPQPSPPPIADCQPWTQSLDLAAAAGHSMVSDVVVVDGCNYVIAGYEHSSHPGEPLGNARGFVRGLRVDRDGSLVAQWEHLLETDGADAVSGLWLDDDRLVFWGTISGALDGQTNAGDKDVVLGVLSLDGRVIKISQLGNEKPNVPLALLATESGELLLVGNDEVYVPTNYVDTWEDPWLASVTEYPTFFALNWIRNHGTEAADIHTAAAVVGESVVTALHGEAGDARGAVLARRDASGEDLWSVKLSNGPYDTINALQATPEGSRLLVLGSTYGSLGDTPAGDADYFLAEIDANAGMVRSIRQFGTPGLDWARVLLTADGRLTVVGEVMDDQGNWTVEIRALSPTGAVVDTRQLRLGESAQASRAAASGDTLLVAGSYQSAGRSIGYLRPVAGGP